MLMTYLLLLAAVAAEIVATSVLPATKGFRRLKPSLLVIVGYTVCFLCLGIVLERMQLGIAYATWGAIGTVVTPVAGYLLYRQRITKTGVFALALITASVVVLNLYG